MPFSSAVKNITPYYGESRHSDGVPFLGTIEIVH